MYTLRIHVGIDQNVSFSSNTTTVAVNILRPGSSSDDLEALVVLVGDDQASAVYVRNKENDAKKVGMYSEVIRLPAASTQAEVEQTVAELNGRDDIDALIANQEGLSTASRNRVESLVQSFYKEVDKESRPLRKLQKNCI